MFLNQYQYERICIMANQLACYYYSPVYLVGSCLQHQWYNDVDIVVIMSDENFERRYGSIEQYLDEMSMVENIVVRRKWAEDCHKRWVQLCDYTGLNIDFKTQPLSIATNHINKPIIRLDSIDCFS